MTYLSLQRTRQQTDLLATDLLPECPGCHELCPAGATVCAECATHLFVRQSNGVGRNSLDGMRAADAEEVTVPMEADEPHCTCGGNGICTYCTLQSYEPLPLEARGMMIALDMTESALRRPAKPTNVVEFRPGPTRLELVDREPTDDAIYNRGGVEGGIGYTVDEPGSLGENDWRL